MNRRSFFATLFAPVVAMALPKPKANLSMVGKTFPSHGHKIGETIHVRKPFQSDEFCDQYLRVALERMAQANEEWLLRYCAVGTGWHDTMVIQQEVNHAASMQAECIMLRPTRTKEEIDAAYADLRAEAVQSGILRSNPVL